METEKLLHKYFNDPTNIILDFAWPHDLDFRQACEYGYFEYVVKYIKYIENDEKIKKTLKFNYGGRYFLLILNCGLNYACKGNHLDIAKLLIEKGANCFNSGLYYACCGNNINLVNYMVNLGSKNTKIRLTGGCYAASGRGIMKLKKN